jgi:outer membrane protein OmpA-like peptidoglycan-associated protein
LIFFPESGDVLTDLGELVCGQSQDAAPPSAVGAPAALPAAPPVPAEEPVRSVSEDDPPSSIVVRVRVDGNGARVTAKGKKALSALVRFLAGHPDSFVEIEGHADRHGPDEAGVRLGMRAANAMKDILVRSGVRAGRIRKVESLGRGKMLCLDETVQCDALNRRVVVRAVRDEGSRDAASQKNSKTPETTVAPAGKEQP